MSEYGENYRHVIGVVGADPKVYSTQKGEIVKFSVVEEDGWGTKLEDGTRIAPPQRWYDVVVWNEGLQAFAKYELHKGKKVAVEGRYSLDTYNDRSRDTINADNIGIVQFGTRTRKGEKPQELVSAGTASNLDF